MQSVTRASVSFKIMFLRFVSVRARRVEIRGSAVSRYVADNMFPLKICLGMCVSLKLSRRRDYSSDTHKPSSPWGDR